MNYSVIKNCDIANGIGVRISIFVSGCTNHCEHCFQPETWDFGYGQKFDQNTIDNIIKLLEPSYINGLTILGGEPMEPKNQSEVLNLIQNVRKIYGNKKDIWIYSGFTFEKILSENEYCNTKYSREILESADVLVDGRFEISKKKLTLRFRGSENQRLIDLKETFKSGEIKLVQIEDRQLG